MSETRVDPIAAATFERLREIVRETFEGGLPGEGTEYLDHRSGIRSTLSTLTAEQASKRRNGHPSIAAHARHMAFHLRTVAQWIQGDRSLSDHRSGIEAAVHVVSCHRPTIHSLQDRNVEATPTTVSR